MGLWSREHLGRSVNGLVHHSDRGVQHVAVRSTQRLAEAGAVAEYVDWFNHRRLHGEIGLVPPAEFETDFHQHNPASASVDALVPSL